MYGLGSFYEFFSDGLVRMNGVAQELRTGRWVKRLRACRDSKSAQGNVDASLKEEIM